MVIIIIDKRDWKLTSNSMENIIYAFRELIVIRDGYKECIDLTNNDVDGLIVTSY